MSIVHCFFCFVLTVNVMSFTKKNGLEENKKSLYDPRSELDKCFWSL